MSPLRMIYLGLAILGAIQPLFHLVPWAGENGFDPRARALAWTASAATSALFWNLIIAALALGVFVLAEVAVRRNWSALLALPATLLFGPGCGLPLYLFLRTRPIV